MILPPTAIVLLLNASATKIIRNADGQCDQIGRFIGLSATFKSLWQQLIWPNLPTFLGNFCKGVKIYHFSSEIFLGNFYRHLAIGDCTRVL